MVLVDTSSWIHMLRTKGDAAVRARVEALLQSGTACWCPMIRLELWNGAGGDREKKALRDLDRLLPELPITEEVWATANGLARTLHARGASVPSTDILIAACARHHGAGLEHADSDFEQIAEA